MPTTHDHIRQTPTDLIRWALQLPPDTPLGAAGSDAGLLALARGVGTLALCQRGWAFGWTSEPRSLYSSVPDMTAERLPEMYARTHAAMLHRYGILTRGTTGGGGDKDSKDADGEADAAGNENSTSSSSSTADPTHLGVLLYERANFRALLKHPNAAPAPVAAAFAQALAADLMEVPLPLVQPPHDVMEAEGWLSIQVMFALEDPAWGEDEPLDPSDLADLDCAACRDDAFTPWELVWKFYSRADLAAHTASYHTALATGHRWLESLRSGSGGGYVCPGQKERRGGEIVPCPKSYGTHETLADHILRSHFDDVGAFLPARYLLPFAEVAAAGAMTTTTAASTANGNGNGNDDTAAAAKATPLPPPPRKLATHAATMAAWLPKMRDWAAAEAARNDSGQTRRFVAFMERHPPGEEFWRAGGKREGGGGGVDGMIKGVASKKQAFTGKTALDIVTEEGVVVESEDEADGGLPGYEL